MSRALTCITLVFTLTLRAQDPVDLPVEHPECSAFSTARGTLTPKQNGALQTRQLSELTVKVSRQLAPRNEQARLRMRLQRTSSTSTYFRQSTRRV